MEKSKNNDKQVRIALIIIYLVSFGFFRWGNAILSLIGLGVMFITFLTTIKILKGKQEELWQMKE